ncbi:MAG: phosphate ABC transporter permease PstA [Nitrospira sp.]|nr:phosphate ABC transporter permease PstA [Candidatus Manganitrophaceae bacterium]HIL34286.1 phosphate ABC transporter permease PstA [Candidatus Manganitrophaceae bacterium]
MIALRRRYRIYEKIFSATGLIITLLAVAVLLTLIVDVFMDGASRLDWNFLTSYPSRRPGKAGILSAWVGTVWVMVLTGIIAFPIGVAAATYLEEYAKKNWLSDLIEINIANLAGVPSIIYGLLGLVIFVRWMDLERSVLAGAMTLAMLVLPIIILSAREALRTIPFTVREASYALGASKWQTIRNQVLPAAMPGILTGTILAMSRAIGETAPLIIIGALTYVAFLPTSPISLEAPYFSLEGLSDPFSVLPIQIFNWVSRPQKGFSVNAAAAILVLLFITFAMNGIAVYLRYRFQKKLRW